MYTKTKFYAQIFDIFLRFNYLLKKYEKSTEKRLLRLFLKENKCVLRFYYKRRFMFLHFQLARHVDKMPRMSRQDNFNLQRLEIPQQPMVFSKSPDRRSRAAS